MTSLTFKGINYISRCIVAALISCAVNAAHAQSSFTIGFNGGEGLQSISIPVGKSQIIESEQTLTQIVIGNPGVADVTLLSPNQFVVVGQAPGITNLMFKDDSNRIVAAMDLEVNYDLEAIQRSIDGLLPRENNVSLSSANGRIVVSGQISNALDQNALLQLLSMFADEDSIVNFLEVGGGQQVMLEARIAEVNRTRLRDLGYQTDILGGSGVETGFEIITGRSAQFLGNSAGLSQAQSTLIPGQPGLIAGTPLTSDFGGVVLNNSSLSQNLNLALSALVQEGAAQVLAEPNIVAMSGQQASFLVGGEFPVPVAQGGGGGGAGGGFAGALSVQYRQFGVGLEFTPSVLASNRINLQLTTEVSDLDLSSGTSVQGTTVPGLRTRRVSTTIELGDGNSFAIAGLLENNIGSLVNEFPGLGSLPIIGALFRSTQFTRDETELVIVVTPRLVSSVDANSISLPTDSYRPPSAFDQVIYGRTEAEPVSSGDSDGQTGEEPRLDGAQGHQF